MKLFITICYIIIFYIPCFGDPATAGGVSPIQAYTIHLPPFSYTKDNKLQGVFIDIYNSMETKLYGEQHKSSLQMVPWARGYQYALKEKNIFLLCAAKTPELTSLFKWIGPVVQPPIGGISKILNDIIITDIEDYNQYRIGTVIDTAPEQLLRSKGVKISAIDRISSLKKQSSEIGSRPSRRSSIWHSHHLLRNENPQDEHRIL